MVRFARPHVTMNRAALLTVPPGVTTLIFPLLAPLGTLTFNLVAVSETMVVAFVPPKVTLVAPDRFVPLMVTVAPTRPLAGICEMVGAGTMQSDALVEPVPTVEVPAGQGVAAVAPVVST
jgi:hypothetical protein